jgi:hypothetical protein
MRAMIILAATICHSVDHACLHGCESSKSCVNGTGPELCTPKEDAHCAWLKKTWAQRHPRALRFLKKQ